MKSNYFAKAVVRVPLYSVDYYNRFFKNGELALEEIIADKVFLSALYLASPQLYYAVLALTPGEVAEDSKKARKLRITLAKYISRLSSRCTPFGLFAGAAVADIGTETSLVVEHPDRHEQHTRLDIQYLFSLTNKISGSPFVKPYLKYSVNTSLYQLGNCYRYLECNYSGIKRKFQLISIGVHEYIARILALLADADGLSIREMARHIVDEDVSEQDATDFIEQLIGAQILVSNLELGTTGDGMEEQIVAVLQDVAARAVAEPEHHAAVQNILAYFLRIKAGARAVDLEPMDNKMAGYLQLKAQAADFKHPFDEHSFLQTDLLTTYRRASIDAQVVEQVQKGVAVLSRFASLKPNAKLEKFKQAFEQRYESRIVPLVEALDIESGIGYGSHMEDSKADVSRLIDDIVFNPAASGAGDQTTINSKYVSFWIGKLVAAQVAQAGSINLTDADLADFPHKEDHLTTTYAALTSLYQNQANEPVVVLQGVSGPTAATWLGRFCNHDPAMKALVDDIARTEQAQHPDKIVAELNHLPEARIGNVLQRPALREYEISYLANSAVDKDHQISINDLMLCLKNNRLVLFSQKYQKEVLPYITNSHYYDNGKNLPLYHFLGDMQELHGQDGAMLELNVMRKFFKHIPRITYGNVILKRASWQFTKKELEPLVQAADGELVARFQAFAEQHRLPALLSIAHGDNEMVISTGNLLSLQVLVNEIKALPALVITEVLFDEFRSLVTNEQGESFNNEALFFLKKEQPTAARPASVPALAITEQDVKREFLPGGEWLYFNLYTGFKNADKLLQELQPAISRLLADGVVDKWFFIRYYDPKFHLRVRFHLKDGRRYDELFDQLYPLLEELKSQKIIWKASVDTYQRELERYGFELIAPVENIFFHDSTMCLELIQRLDLGDSEEMKWLASLYSINAYFDVFGLTLQQRKDFVDKVHRHFTAEFNAEGITTRIIDKKYRDNRAKIHSLLDGSLQNSFVDDVVSIVARRDARLTQDVAALTSRYPVNTTFLDSLIHMHVNRIFRTRQRIYEFVLYSFLRKHYASVVAQQAAAVPA